jgi:hypothetical protein
MKFYQVLPKKFGGFVPKVINIECKFVTEQRLDITVLTAQVDELAKITTWNFYFPKLLSSGTQQKMVIKNHQNTPEVPGFMLGGFAKTITNGEQKFNTER